MPTAPRGPSEHLPVNILYLFDGAQHLMGGTNTENLILTSSASQFPSEPHLPCEHAGDAGDLGLVGGDRTGAFQNCGMFGLFMKI